VLAAARLGVVDPEAELLGDRPVRLPRAGSDAEREVLETGSRDAWRPPRWLVLVVLLVVLAGGVGWSADREARAHESAALARCQRDLHAAVISSDLLIVAAVTNVRPVLATTTGRRHEALLASISIPARRLLPAVVGADRRCRAVSVVPWHRSLRSRRDATTTYSRALAARVKAIAEDGSAYYGHGAHLRRLRRSARIGVFGGRY
jgi:hypothetical protein